MNKQYQYLIGVDGGGTGTRVLLADANGADLGRGSGGPSGLMHGAEQAWQSILAAIKRAFLDAGLNAPAYSDMAIGCGLAGVNNKQWAADFTAKNPGFAGLVLETDAGTTLLGAHQGEPGVVIALGTGSVGEVMMEDGSRREVGGWGFPSSDEASGAWLGLRAINHVQHVLDGRSEADDLSAALIAYCIAQSGVSKDSGKAKDAVFNWLAQANQTKFAQLAPIVIDNAPHVAKANEMMLAAGAEVVKMARALDPTGLMPIALCGGLAEPMTAYLPQELKRRVIKPKGDSASGALILVKNYFLKCISEG
ncbi:MAG: BadF/BadG/BcrA/BcrD ATPase family protein [Undibacterium sp.]|nr:BadF/BadG/BcrA/BcrD ATPase family protein [Undibacterium sp.]